MSLHREMRNQGWQDHFALLAVVSLDGESISGWLMRQKTPDGKWIYRRMTAAELDELNSQLAW